jgi:hypothetical protein
LRANPFFLAGRRQRHDRADHEPEFDHFPGIVEFDVIGAGIMMVRPGIGDGTTAVRNTLYMPAYLIPA